jgi:N-acetylneuraminate synthase
MSKTVKIGNILVGEGQPTFIIAELGINHNGNMDVVKKLIDTAILSGCNAVKFQKRHIPTVYTKEELETPRESVFGKTNGDLKRGLELKSEQYKEIDRYCRGKGMLWFASPWDVKSVDYLNWFDPPCYKIPSALITNDELLRYVASKEKPMLISTGMSTLEEIDHAMDTVGEDNVILYHCTSTYPTDHYEANLSVIKTLKERYNCPIGYSGHERGVTTSVLAVSLGACSVERHITLDRTLWGSDQAASLEPSGLVRLVRDIRMLPELMGDGIKKIYDSEIPIRKKLSYHER